MPADFFVFVLYCSRLFVSLQQKTNSLNIYEATTNWELGTWNASSLWQMPYMLTNPLVKILSSTSLVKEFLQQSNTQIGN